MKIFVDKDSYVEIKNSRENLSLSIKTKRDNGTSFVITAELDEDQLDSLITELVSIRTKIQEF